ncbi:MAG: hypothetical protein PHP50_14500 [Lachnospiraceae bacterium]|nr:hypothetical protein [Lachnospiraceae bacterium]
MMRKEQSRLSHRIKTIGMHYEETALVHLNELLSGDTPDYTKVVKIIEKLAV